MLERGDTTCKIDVKELDWIQNKENILKGYFYEIIVVSCDVFDIGKES